ncbi:MAG: lipoprotein-releasing ABC transporter permease subunit [Betaproteobacteria bacterium]|nr:lipoprotein-releasing ABC transporter permease subunit [Betaproteobacteria bacterium]MCC6249342.1 lipoprotein-releasing ABC transporter permease subunit [Rubrivivax sp.]
MGGFNAPYEWQIGWRYLRAGRGARHNRFINFIAGFSMLGIALGVAALIVVLSVMNGFQKEVRDRMLDVIAHVEVHDVGGGALARSGALRDAASREADVRASAPFLQFQALVGTGETLRGALVRGIVPAQEAAVTPLVGRLVAERDPAIAALTPGAMAIVMGAELARTLGLKTGDPVAVVLPPRGRAPGGDAAAPPAAGEGAATSAPRTFRFVLAGTFEAGHYEYDSAFAYVHAADGAALLDLPAPVAIQLRLADALAAPAVAARLAAALGPEAVVRDWTQTNRTWFEAVHLQKRMLGLILVLIVAVAAFNLVSTLVMTVTDKRADIAILRTLGASPRSIVGIFFVQGAAAGLVGTALGVAIGLVVALNIGHIVPAIEGLLGTKLLPASIYFISRMPSLPLASDIVPIALASLALAFLATLYPSWRASRVQPAVELRGE